MKSWVLQVMTRGERFYEITNNVKESLQAHIGDHTSGHLILYNPHTSCGLTINEAYEQSASNDMERFLKHLAPRNLSFIEHTTEGPDDSPSHMKSILLESSLNFIVEDRNILMGQWQGVYLCEFRDGPKERNLRLKFIPDPQ